MHFFEGLNTFPHCYLNNSMRPTDLNILYIPPWFSIEKQPLSGTFFKEQFKLLTGYLNKLTVLEIEAHPLIEWKNLFKKNTLTV